MHYVNYVSHHFLLTQAIRIEHVLLSVIGDHIIDDAIVQYVGATEQTKRIRGPYLLVLRKLMLEFEFLCDHPLQLLYSGHQLFIDRGRLQDLLVPGGIVYARN